MEKIFEILVHEYRGPELRRPISQKLLVLGCLLILSLQLTYGGHQLASYAFSASKPGFGINWTPCGENIDCGHLSVPLDYHNLSLGTASLALARYRATNSTGRLGTIFTNPGGPGGSGVNFIYRAGPRISGIVDGLYDIVSWDPRGINGTSPRVECFHSQTSQQLYYLHSHQEMGLEGRNLTDPTDLSVFTAGVHRADAHNAAVAKLCADVSGDVLKHVGTATVVRDLEFLSRVIEGDDAPVHFWGFSYGTIVGSYFVNMFPKRTGRIIIDGVVDPVLWATSYSNEWYKYDLVDTDRVFENFIQACQTAGPDYCALASNKSTTNSIRARVDKLLNDLYEYPLPVDQANRPGVLTSGMIKGQIFRQMYTPGTWSELATNLAATMQGNGTVFMNTIQEAVELTSSVKAKTVQAVNAVICVDAPPYTANMDKSAGVQKNIDEAILTYEMTSRRFASLQLDICHHWTPRGTERFTGPFNSSLSSQILIIGNTADPITPVVNAKVVNQLLGNSSRLLIQDGSGHCSTAMASLCTGKVIKDYLLEGRLPPNGMICHTDQKLFPPPVNANNAMTWIAEDMYDQEDKRLLQSLKALGEEIQPFLMQRLH